MNNITIKKADATTNVIFVAKRPFSGTTPALYTLDAASPVPLNRPRLSILERSSQSGKGNKVEVTFAYPVVQTVDGQPVVKAIIPFTAVGTVPLNVSDTEIAEAAMEFVNLLAQPEVYGCFKSGYAPR